MIDLQQLLLNIAEVTSADLGDAATVSVSKPTSKLQTAVVRIRPLRAGAAPIDLWAEDDAIAACAGDRAQFFFEAESEEGFIAKATSLVRDVAEGCLIDRYLGGRYLTSTLEHARNTRIARLVRWAPYRD